MEHGNPVLYLHFASPLLLSYLVRLSQYLLYQPLVLASPAAKFPDRLKKLRRVSATSIEQQPAAGDEAVRSGTQEAALH